MSIIEFIGFVIIMVASVILSFKRKREKKESLDIFEQFEEKENKPHLRKRVFEDAFEDEEEDEIEDEYEIKPVLVKEEKPRPVIPALVKEEKPRPVIPALVKEEKPRPVIKEKIIPVLPSAPPVPVAQGKKDFLIKDQKFDMHNEAFTKKGWSPSESSHFLGKLKSLQEAIVIQEIMNKPKGW